MISKYQLFCIMMLSRISSQLAFPQLSGYSATDFAALLTAEVIRLALALPVIVYSAKGRDFYGAAARKNLFWGYAMALVSGFSAAFLAARTILMTAEYAQRTITTGMSAAVLAVVIAAFAVYTAVKGVEALSRAGVLFLAAAAVVTLAVVLADIPHLKMREISGAELSGDFWYHVFEQMMRGGEYLIFAALLPFVKKGGCGTALVFSVSSVAAIVLLGIFSMSVLGEFYGIAEYPFTAAAQLADITLFKRLDGFTAAVWTLGAAFRSGLLLYTVYAAVNAVVRCRETTAERSAA